MTKQSDHMCTQQRLKSANQSSLSTWRSKHLVLCYPTDRVPSDHDQTAQMCRLIWIFAGHLWIWAASWRSQQSDLDAQSDLRLVGSQIILLVLWRGGSYLFSWLLILPIFDGTCTENFKTINLLLSLPCLLLVRHSILGWKFLPLESPHANKYVYSIVLTICDLTLPNMLTNRSWVTECITRVRTFHQNKYHCQKHFSPL